MLETITIFDDVPASKTAQSHRVTDIKQAIRDQNRVNIYVDNKFFCSLDIAQVVDLKIKVGKELSDEDRSELKRASEFGKFYQRALEFALMRPRSQKEIRDYLNRKTLNRKVCVKNRKTGEYQAREKQGYDKSLIPLVLQRLDERGYIDDRRFAELWIENRNTAKGISTKKLRTELLQKGISQQIVDEVLETGYRNDADELQKIIVRKANRYPDRQKFIQYLVRQGFNYSDVVDAISSLDGS